MSDDPGVALPGRSRHLRHDPARRRPVRGHLADRRGQVACRRAARLVGRALDRGRLPPGQPARRGVLPPRAHGPAPRHRRAGGLRLDPPSGRQGRRRPHPRRPGRRGDLDGLHRRQELGLPRHRGPPDEPRRGRGHGVRVGRVPRGRRPARLLRRRALLRRLQGQPRLRPVGGRGGRHGRGRVRRAVRHQRRLAAPRGAAHHRRGARLPDRRRHRHPHAERLRLRGGQLDRGGGRWGDARTGHRQRLRRAHRQRQPDDGDP